MTNLTATDLANRIVSALCPDYQDLTEKLATATQQVADLTAQRNALQATLDAPAAPDLTVEQWNAAIDACSDRETNVGEALGSVANIALRLAKRVYRVGFEAGRARDTKPDPAPGTGAWAWEQMQRGPKVWVRRREAPAVRYHMKHPGLIENSFGGQFNGVEPKVLEQMWPLKTDWELCAAPGSKEAPTPAPSAKDGPTEEQCQEFLDRAYGYGIIALSRDMLRSFTFCWQAAREGMVPQTGYDSVVTSLSLERDRLRAELTSAESRTRELANAKCQLEMSSLIDTEQITQLKGQLTAAERRVGELEGELKLLKAGDPTTHECNQLRAELERVKVELLTFRQFAITTLLNGELSDNDLREHLAAEISRLKAIESEHGFARDQLQSAVDEFLGWRETKTLLELVKLLPDELAALQSDNVTAENMRAAEKLVCMLRLYPDHHVSSRGPIGCIHDALSELAPSILDELQSGTSASDVYAKFWNEDGETQDSTLLTPASDEQTGTRLRALEELFAALCELLEKPNATPLAIAATVSLLKYPPATAPASDEVTEEEAYAIRTDATREASKKVPNIRSTNDNTAFDREFVMAFVRLARRNHGGSATELGVAKTRIIELEAVAKSFDLAMDALAQIENLCGSDQELEPDEVVELVRKTLLKPQPSSNPLQLPLSGGQRAELAKVARDALVPEGAHWPVNERWPLVVDAIAPRIAMVGVESGPVAILLHCPLCNARHVDDGEFATKPHHTHACQACGHCWRPAIGPTVGVQFLPVFKNETVLAAAQGGERVHVGFDPAIGPDETAYVTSVSGTVRPSTPDEIAIAKEHQPPRGRKLTDGERQHLNSLALRWSRGDADCSFTVVTSFVESLLAPQDEVRVALGVCELQGVDWNRAIYNKSAYPYPFGNPLQREITQALSASPGDKFEFSVVARKVEK